MIQDRNVLMISMKRFFSVRENIAQMLSVVRGHDSSLRTIEWFVTHFAKSHDTVTLSSGGPMNVYNSYRSALKTFSKEQFDPFRRHDRISFRFGESDDDEIETTVGQLNFFKWAIESGVISYIRDNRQAIDRAMLESGVSKRSRIPASAPSGAEAKPPPPPGAAYTICSTTLTFD